VFFNTTTAGVLLTHVGQQFLYPLLFKQNAVAVYRLFDGISPMTPLAGKRAIEIVRDAHQKIRENTYYFVTRFINSREGEVINILDSSYRLPIYRHIGQWSMINPLFPIPVHS